jgi:hypothetical protein
MLIFFIFVIIAVCILLSVIYIDHDVSLTTPSIISKDSTHRRSLLSFIPEVNEEIPNRGKRVSKVTAGEIPKLIQVR